MHLVLKLLVSGLEFEEREAVVRRVEAMESELNYLTEHKPQDVRKAARHGWSAGKLKVVFCLNSFYQRILSPLVASSTSPRVVGGDIPIRYGKSLRFDEARNARMREMDDAFSRFCVEMDILPYMLEAQHAGDLVWRLAHPRDQ
jgi:hypothetical protein